MGCRCASLAALSFEQEDPVAPDFWQAHLFKHAVIVPLLCVSDIKLSIFVAVCEDYRTVLRINVLDSCLPEAQNILIANCWPGAGLEKQDHQGDWLWLGTVAFIKSSHPVNRRNASIVQSWRVDQVDVGHLATRRFLSH